MIFKSRQVNLDPLAEMCHCGTDVANHGPLDNHSPVKVQRPEFEPTRDPWPWEHPDGTRWYAEDGACWPESGPDAGLVHEWSNVLKWAPRREQFDTPVNRVLVAFRDAGRRANLQPWMDVRGLPDPVLAGRMLHATSDEIDHARRVLTRLANLKETT